MTTKKVVVPDLNTMSEKDKIKQCLYVFNEFFPKTYNLIHKNKFKTLDDFKESLMFIDENVIKSETENSVKKLKEIVLKDKNAMNTMKEIKCSMSTPQGRFSYYKLASWYKGIIKSTEEIAGQVEGKNIKYN